MQGSSRASAAHGQRALDALLVGGPGRTVAYAGLADELFSVCGALESSAALRRALTDPTREAAAKAQLANRLFGDKLSAPAVQLVTTLVEQRWSSERDLVDTVENFAVQSLAAGAETRGRSDSVEDELFRFERIVAGTASLRDAVTDRKADPATRAQVVATLLEGKAQPETVRLARQAVLAPRGRRFDRVIAGYLSIISTRREQLSATVTSAQASRTVTPTAAQPRQNRDSGPFTAPVNCPAPSPLRAASRCRGPARRARPASRSRSSPC